MRNSNFHLLSFWIGVAVASLFWWIFYQLRQKFPVIKEWAKQQVEKARARRLAGIHFYLRQDSLRRAQQAHISSRLFALDEIVIPPKLLAPPASFFHPEHGQTANESICGRLIPYIPEIPELTAQYPVQKLTPFEVIEKGMNIAVVGQPGTGKTVCLSYLASQIARKAPETGTLAELVPLFLHVHEVDLTPVGKAAATQFLIRQITTRLPVTVSGRGAKNITRMIEAGNLLLLLDGLDELPPSQLQDAVDFLKSLQNDYPQIKMIVSASDQYMDGLTTIGFYPLALATWSSSDQENFLHKWDQAWTSWLSSEKGKETKGVSPLLAFNWLRSEQPKVSPLMLTLRAWAAYSGDASGSSSEAAVHDWVTRLVGKSVPLSAMQALAWEIVEKKSPAMSFNQVETFLGRFRLPGEDQETGISADADTGKQPAHDEKKSRKKGKKISSAGRAIERLLQSGLVREYAGAQISIAHPVLVGCLAAGAANPSFLIEDQDANGWTYASEALHFLSHRNAITSWMVACLRSKTTLIYRYPLLFARWLADAPIDVEWRSLLMRHLLTLYNEELPVGLRARALGTLIVTNEASLSLIFKQSLTSQSAGIRQFSALGLGAIRNEKLIDDLVGLYRDGVPEVREASCLALGAIHSDRTLRIMAETILKADENLRMTAAEIFSAEPNIGHEVLKDALETGDLITRRAAVFGLALIRRADWVRKIFEKIAVEDGQWVVRNAAGQALEEMTNPVLGIPEPTPPPDETDWLIAFAGKKGTGIPKGDPATSLLIQALQSGTSIEKTGALYYLRDHLDEEVSLHVNRLLYDDDLSVQNMAAWVLWYQALTAKKIASPFTYTTTF